MARGKVWIAVLVALIALAVGTTAAQSQSIGPFDFTDWTDVTANVATGSLLGHTVTLQANPNGQVNPPPASVLNGSSGIFNESFFSPPIPAGDAINFVATTGGLGYRLNLGGPTANPVIHLDSLASTLNFAGVSSITKLSGETTFTVAGTTVSGVPDGPGDDSSGTIQLNGTYNTVDFTATYPPGTEGIYVQVGARRPVTTTPPPPTPPRPFIKALRRVKPVESTVDYGILEATPSGNWTHLVWDIHGGGGGRIVSDAGQTALRFRPEVGQYVTVYPIGPGGRGPTDRLNLALKDVTWPTPAGAKIQRRVAGQPAVLTTGRGDLLAGKNFGRIACSITQNAIKTVAGNLEIKGCLRPINSIADVPNSELGIVQPLAEGTVEYFTCAKCAGDDIKSGTTTPAIALNEGFVTDNSVLVNGVKLDPESKSSIVVYPGANLLASSAGRLSAGGLEFEKQTNFMIDSTFRGAKVPLGSFRPVKAPSGGFGSFGVDTSSYVPIDLLAGNAGRAAQGLIKPNLKLPEWLRAAGSIIPVNVDMAIVDGKPVLNGLHVGVKDADIGVAALKDFAIDYHAEPDDEWRGEGTLCLLGVCRLKMDLSHGGGVIVRGGELAKAGADLDLSPGIPLGPGVDLTSLGFTLERHPTVVEGRGHVRAAGLLGIDGSAFAAWGSASEPWHPDRGALFGFPNEFYNRGHTAFAIGLGGRAGVDTPLGTIPLARGYFTYEDGRIGFGGGIDADLFDVVEFHGGFFGNLALPKYRFGGSVEACINVLFAKPCGGAAAVVSSHGFGGCVDNETGGGYVYGDGISVSLWGCRWSEFDEKSIRGARASAAGDVLTVKIKKGQANDRMIKVEGTTAPPRVQLVGSGAKVRIAPTIPKWKTTFIGLKDAKPGNYTVRLLPGSSAVKKVATGVIPGPAKVKASVRGKGSRRVLRYSVRRRPGQSVTFVDMSADGAAKRIGTTKGGKGRFRFSPGPGKGRRRVVAQFELAGLSAEQLTVATFRPPSPKLGAVHKLKVRRKRSRIKARWRKVRGATRYEVALITSRGTLKIKRTRRARITLKGIGKTTSGRVSVRAVAKGRAGKATGKRFKRLRKPKTRFHALSKCTRKKTKVACRARKHK